MGFLTLGRTHILLNFQGLCEMISADGDEDEA